MNPGQPWLRDRPVRNLNPGDLRPRQAPPSWPGQCEIDTAPGGPFAVFLTAADGWCALGLWCLDARYLRGLATVEKLVGVFAPPVENDTACYAASVEIKLGDQPLDLWHKPVLEALCRAIAHYEEHHQVWTDVEIAAGMRLCTARWPAYRAARIAASPFIPREEVTADDLNAGQLIHPGRLA